MKRGTEVKLVVCVIIIFLLLLSLVLAPAEQEEGSKGTGSSESEEHALPEDSDLSDNPGYTAANEEEKTPAQFNLEESELETPTKVTFTEPQELTLTTAQGSSTATYNYFVGDKNGIYEATITGIAAGTTIYFLSYFDNQLFELQAGSDESEIRMIQFSKKLFTIEFQRPDPQKSNYEERFKQKTTQKTREKSPRKIPEK